MTCIACLFLEVMMKKLIMIGGTMGVGKTTISQLLKKELNHSVMLDGDWCWDMHPFIVNDETKKMVMDNIVYQLHSLLFIVQLLKILFFVGYYMIKVLLMRFVKGWIHLIVRFILSHFFVMKAY